MLIFPQRKQLRAPLIAEYAKTAKYPGVVAFSCGNAAQALRDCGVDVLEIGPRGKITPAEWWTPACIHATWPHLFDATSGHLPLPLLWQIAQCFRDFLGPLAGDYIVPTGSGETITALRMAYPLVNFRPVYNVGSGTQYDAANPLNLLALGNSGDTVDYAT